MKLFILINLESFKKFQSSLFTNISGSNNSLRVETKAKYPLKDHGTTKDTPRPSMRCANIYGCPNWNVCLLYCSNK